eukprot:SAG31_NODE_23592_length_501_cov_0.636816_1_plen_101_part_01
MPLALPPHPLLQLQKIREAAECLKAAAGADEPGPAIAEEPAPAPAPEPMPELVQYDQYAAVSSSSAPAAPAASAGDQSDAAEAMAKKDEGNKLFKAGQIEQ